MKQFLLGFLILIGLCLHGFSQNELWNKKIDEAQRVLCKKDSVNGYIVNLSNNAEVNLVTTRFLINKVDEWQKYIVGLQNISNNDRIKLFRVLLNEVISFNKYARSKNKDFKASLAQELFANTNKTLDAYRGLTSLDKIIEPMGYLASRIILEDEYANMVEGYNTALELFVLKDCNAHPDRILNILSANPNFKYADSLIVVAAYRNQDMLYDYTQCTKCALYSRLKNHPHPLVQTLFKMGQMESGRSLTPFLDAISRKEITIDSINKLQWNPSAYYKLLVTTRIKYSNRLSAGEEILAIKNFNAKIKEVALDFVKEINELHTKADNIRFASLNPLNAQELYYMAVLGIDDLYTSSFNRGVFAQLMAKLNGISTDKLLGQVNSDYFRKFIKISAGYNKLSIFLKAMPDSSAKVWMNNFISDLVKNDNLYDIEDAVDVADAYVGIGANADLKNVSDQILLKINDYQTNYKKENDTKGTAIYNLLDLIFKSYKDTTIDLSAQLKLPPINKVEYKSLATDKDKTIVKLYFYGDEDKDGQMSFINFMGLFGDRSRWKVEGNPDFVNIKSLKGRPIQIFANRALYDYTKKTDPDDSAKLRMSAFMVKQGLTPTFVMHRGHSYHVPITLDYMNKYDTAAKLIVLGSCGGYQNLQRVLEICPESHIVSSKQTGTMRVNDPMLSLLFDDLSMGKNIMWNTLWARLKVKVGGGDAGEMFEEYIAPNKNLGMIFIKAYKKMMQL
jgi:hypothetical protein